MAADDLLSAFPDHWTEGPKREIDRIAPHDHDPRHDAENIYRQYLLACHLRDRLRDESALRVPV